MERNVVLVLHARFLSHVSALFVLKQGSGTYGSRASCGFFDDGIWLA